MAAQLNPTVRQPYEIADLRQFGSRHLDSLLDEEIAAWRDELEWDFSGSADLVRRFVDMHALNGAALLENGEATGYVYYVLEDDKGLIGDLYVRRPARTAERENALLEWALDGLFANPAAARIEAQIMMLDRNADRALPAARNAGAFERNFMRVDMAAVNLDEGRVRRPCYIERWSNLYQDAAAQLVAASYAGHVDARINDQYRSPAGARRFLHNIMNYPGCGVFTAAASWAAFEAASGRMCGMSLASMVSPGCGHITQICTSPAARGMGIGHQLLRQSLMSLRDLGCRSTSLTVTAANENAVKLYERVGFRTVKRFPAFVWEGFRR